MTETGRLSEGEFEARRGATRRLLGELSLDALVAFSSYQERDGHVAYLTNHRIALPDVQSHLGLGHAAFVLPVDGKTTLVSPLGCCRETLSGVDEVKTGPDLVEELTAAVRRSGLEGSSIGIAGTDVLPAEYFLRFEAALVGATVRPADDLLESQRMVKSAAEVALLRRAAHVADAGLRAALETTHQGVSEREIELAVRREVAALDADSVPRVRIASGKTIRSSSWPAVGARRLQDGDLVRVDLAGWYGGYAFSGSRVTCVGKPSVEQRRCLDHAAEATEWMTTALRTDSPVRFVYTESRGRSIIPFGHGIGLEACERPWLTMGAEVALRPSMVLCIGPTLVAPGLGDVSIADMVLVTKTGVEVLSESPRVVW